jgi:hypothetical protein
MVRVGGALGRRLPCDELPCPLLPCPLLPAAALVDGPPPAPPLTALPLPIGCLPSGASAVPRVRHDALSPCAMDTPSNRVPWSSASCESRAVAHLPLSGLLALLLLDQQRRIALRLILGLLRGPLGRLLLDAGGTF